jgi:hypothetical protein
MILEKKILYLFSLCFIEFFLFFFQYSTCDRGFKNQTGERTEKGSGFHITGWIGIGPVVEPITS